MYIFIEYLKTIAKLCLGYGVQKSYSQFGEDAIVQSLCKRSCGFYVDVGTYHPVLYSNTYALYKKGWHGLAIDPNVSLKPLYRLFRSRDTFISAGVGSGEEEMYYMFSDGAYNTFNIENANACKKLKWLRYLGSIKLPILSLSRIVQEHEIKEIGLLNIDVEGNDMEVLQSYNWSVRPNIIIIESSEFNVIEPDKSEIYRFLHNKKYRLTGFSGVSLIWSDNTL